MLTAEQSVKNLESLITHCLSIGVFKKKEDFFTIHESIESVKTNLSNGESAGKNKPGNRHIDESVARNRNNSNVDSRKKKEKAQKEIFAGSTDGLKKVD